MTYIHSNPAVPSEPLECSEMFFGNAGGIWWTLDISETYVFGWDGERIFTVAFEVGGSFDHQGRKEGFAIVRQALRAWRTYLGTVPSGTVFTCRPHTEDGHGERRRAFYKTLGFRDVA
jgi:hypothetical protein